MVIYKNVLLFVKQHCCGFIMSVVENSLLYINILYVLPASLRLHLGDVQNNYIEESSVYILIIVMNSGPTAYQILHALKPISVE